MPNIASVLKAEFARIARKEVRAEVQALKKSAAALRSEITQLKRRLQGVELQVRSAGRAKGVEEKVVHEASSEAGVRFSAKSLASQRRRLGLSAADCGRLIGASGVSIYKWEGGQARPRAKYIDAIARLRSMGKKEAAARLEALRQAQ